LARVAADVNQAGSALRSPGPARIWWRVVVCLAEARSGGVAGAKGSKDMAMLDGGFARSTSMAGADERLNAAWR